MNAENESPIGLALVIDDSKIDRFIVEKLIERVKFADSVVGKELAREGLDFLRELMQEGQKPPRVIFLDINMPEMSGFDFLDEFCTFPKDVVDQCAVVMLSSSLNEDDHKRAMSYPPVKMYCNKPISVNKLDELRALLASATSDMNTSSAIE